MTNQTTFRLMELTAQLLPGGRRPAGGRPRRSTSGRSEMEIWTVGLYVLASAFAVLATAGGVALIVGAIDPQGAAVAEMLWHSPVGTGVVLIAVAAVPTACSSVALYRMAPNAGRISLIAGLTLIAAVVLGALIAEQPTWFSVPLVSTGLVLAAGGLRLDRIVGAGARQRPVATGLPNEASRRR